MASESRAAITTEKQLGGNYELPADLKKRMVVVERAFVGGKESLGALLRQAERQSMITLEELGVRTVESRNLISERATQPGKRPSYNDNEPSTAPKSDMVERLKDRAPKDAALEPVDAGTALARREVANALQPEIAAVTPTPVEMSAQPQPELKQPKGNGLDEQKILKRIYELHDNPEASNET